MAKTPGEESTPHEPGPIEQKALDFAEDLGRLLGTAQAKAQNWLGQRQAIADQLTAIRDTAQKYLTDLTGSSANVVAVLKAARKRGRPPGSGKKTRGPGRPRKTAAAVKTSGKKRGRPPGSGKKKRGMSDEGKARVAAAQKARWAKIRAEKGE
jgi:hypothetical protein